MGGYAPSDPLSETLGLPPELSGQLRKRGMWPALMNIGQDEYFGSKPEPDSGEPRLAQLMKQGDGGTALNASADQVQNPMNMDLKSGVTPRSRRRALPHR
jgi:hypothetical protein